MTDRLYYTDSYLTEFSATVVGIDGVRVHLDRTAFYPTSGGQPFDTGTLGGTRVLDVIDEPDHIVHLLAAPPAFAPGAVVSGTVDWTRRFDNMQQHTGQHLISAIFEDLFGHKTASVHFGEQASTLDLDTELLSRDRAAKAERRANELVLENRAIRVGFENAATASGLRKPSDRTGDIRVVAIENADRSACGGTHVRSTAEIGPVAIRRIEKYKKLTRVEFLCGWRAIAKAKADFDALTSMAGALTTSADELPVLVASQAAALRESESERRKLGDELAARRVREFHAAAVSDASGLRRFSTAATSMDELRSLAQAASLLPQTLFVATVNTPPAIALAVSADSGLNAGTILKAALAAHGGRGGGSPRVAQGTVENSLVLAALERELLEG